MRILLDECLPRPLKRELPGDFYVATVPECGWAGIKNGRLLALAQTKFDVFLTVDRSLASQQNLASVDIAVIALRAVSNDIDDLRPLVPAVVAALTLARPGTVLVIGA